MLSNTTLLFFSFINLFLIPIIGVKIYCNRHSIPLDFSAKTTYLYILMIVLNIPTTRILVNVVESIISSTIYVETTKYTVIALISCVLLPYIMESIEKFIQINVEISVRNFKRKEIQKNLVAMPSEEINEN